MFELLCGVRVNSLSCRLCALASCKCARRPVGGCGRGMAGSHDARLMTNNLKISFQMLLVMPLHTECSIGGSSGVCGAFRSAICTEKVA